MWATFKADKIIGRINQTQKYYKERSLYDSLILITYIYKGCSKETTFDQNIHLASRYISF